MPEYVVADHHYDPLAELWRLSIGTREIVEERIVENLLDEHGEQVYEPGEVQSDGEGNEFVLQGPAVTTVRTEEREVIVVVEDFAFTALDPKWEGKSEDEIVHEQKRLVRAALRKREKDAADATAGLRSLPGIGDAL
jgi:hypothetical protein